MKKIIIKYTILLICFHLITEYYSKYILYEWLVSISELLDISVLSSSPFIGSIINTFLSIFFIVFIFMDLKKINVRSSSILLLTFFSPISGSTIFLLIYKYHTMIRSD